MTNKRCETCRYWVTENADRAGPMLVGSCHRLPPFAAGVVINGLMLSRFPLVLDKEWCGEYAPKKGG